MCLSVCPSVTMNIHSLSTRRYCIYTGVSFSVVLLTHVCTCLYTCERVGMVLSAVLIPSHTPTRTLSHPGEVKIATTSSTLYRDSQVM